MIDSYNAMQGCIKKGAVLSVQASLHIWECSGSVVECLTRDQGDAGSSLTGVTVLCP